jgi:hypothetical protein
MKRLAVATLLLALGGAAGSAATYWHLRSARIPDGWINVKAPVTPAGITAEVRAKFVSPGPRLQGINVPVATLGYHALVTAAPSGSQAEPKRVTMRLRLLDRDGFALENWESKSRNIPADGQPRELSGTTGIVSLDTVRRVVALAIDVSAVPAGEFLSEEELTGIAWDEPERK